MAGKTVDDLKRVREDLADQLAREAYDLTSGVSQRGLERLVLLNEAIYALDNVIEEGRGEPEAAS